MSKKYINWKRFINWKYIVIIVAVFIVIGFSIYMVQPLNKNPVVIKSVENISYQEPVSAGVYRKMPSFASVEDSIDIYLNVTLGNSKYYVIEEIVPGDFVIKDSGTGKIDNQGHIKWIILNDANNTLLKYTLVSPKTAGKYLFSGKFSIGSSEEFFIIGNTQIQVK